MHSDDFTMDNFRANLKLASSYYPSVAELCRKLGINRQQFMKYLAGTSFPARYNLRRICDFFGVDEFEILMPHEQFSNIIRLRPSHKDNDLKLPPDMRRLLKDAQRQKSILNKFYGYYYEYYLSFSTPGHILRALTCIYGWEDFTLYKRIERVNRKGADSPTELYKYSGIVTVTGDRLHMFDKETITGAEISQRVLFFNYKNRVSVLTGLTLGVSGSDSHKPSASRVVMEHLGKTTNLRQAIAGCGVFPKDADEIPKAIVNHLTNDNLWAEPMRGATFDTKK